MIDAHRLSDAGNLQDAPRISRHIRIIGDALPITLECAVIGGIETDQRDEQADIRFGQLIADKIAAVLQPVLKLTQHREHIAECFLIGFLRHRKAGIDKPRC